MVQYHSVLLLRQARNGAQPLEGEYCRLSRAAGSAAFSGQAFAPEVQVVGSVLAPGRCNSHGHGLNRPCRHKARGLGERSLSCLD